MKGNKFLKKLGIAVCFIFAVVIIFTGSADNLLIRKRVCNSALEGKFAAEQALYVSPLSSYFYSEDELKSSMFNISDDVFETPRIGYMGDKIENPIYEYQKSAFKVVDGKPYMLLAHGMSEDELNNMNSIDVSAYLTRIALKVLDKNGNDTGYVIYKFIDADKQAHVYLAKFEQEENKSDYAMVMLQLKNVDE